MERDAGFRGAVRRAWARYERFVEKRGFFVVLAACVLVILVSGVLTYRMRDALENPSLPPSEATRAAGGAQDAQTLAQAMREGTGALATDAPEAAKAPVEPLPPVKGFVSRAFSDEPVYFKLTRTWQTHPAVDFEAEYGATVAACLNGTVASVGEEGALGLCVRIEHADGYESLYAGLSEAPYARAGDRVSAGRTIGHVGNGVLHESDGAPHLHFALFRNGEAVDPLGLLLGLDD